MHLFKININELIIILILSAPIGAFLYLHNSNKILIEYNFPRGYGYVHNLCETIPNIYIVDILSDSDRMSLISGHSSDKFEMAIEMPKANLLYQIKLKGTNDQLGAMHQKIAKIKNDLNRLEGNKFKDLLGDINIHCGTASYKAYKYIPLNIEIIQENIKSKYKNGYLLFLLICPFIILYLFLISFKYLKNKYLRIY